MSICDIDDARLMSINDDARLMSINDAEFASACNKAKTIFNWNAVHSAKLKPLLIGMQYTVQG